MKDMCDFDRALSIINELDGLSYGRALNILEIAKKELMSTLYVKVVTRDGSEKQASRFVLISEEKA